MTMSNLSILDVDASLHVRDGRGRYRPASVDQILAAARRVADLKVQRGAEFTSPVSAKKYLCAKLAGLEYEVFAVLFLDTKHRLIEYVEMFRGTIDTAAVHPREVVKEALRLNAAAVILAHNHPSGNPTPSETDRQITERLRSSLGLVDVRTLDHFIIAGSRAVSMAMRGWR